MYMLLPAVLSTVLGPIHGASLSAIADLVGALLATQSLHASDLARALPDLQTAQARQAQRRVRRILGRSCLSGPRLTPWLIRAALQLVSDAEVSLVLDSTRCLRWEIFTLGVRWHGRVVPIAWQILPYPWPKRQFTPTVLALLDRTLAHWPADRPLHLVADRGFPSLKLFGCLARWRERVPLGYTIRLRASDWVRPGDEPAVKVGDLERAVPVGTWTVQQAAYRRRGRAVPSSVLVIGHGLPVYPSHQMGPADRARRTSRARGRVDHLISKAQPGAALSDRVWALLSTKATWREAVRAYTGRFATEGTYRDVKTWDLEAVASHETDLGHLDGLMGLASLGYLVQAAIGSAAGRATDQDVRARQQQWSTTDRLSIFWRGRQVLRDPVHNWLPFLSQTLSSLAATCAPKSTVPEPTPVPRTNRPHQEAA
ncbi:MAG TPA: hypothetical protein VFZ25_16455 [Chloroflexota bacterium]|nr:hypothetical protein [Chloroflexota bacterium]